MARRKFELPGIQDLGKEQEAARALPREGQHLIVGGPGTGKSVLALIRARRQGAGLKLSTPSAFGSVYAGAQHVVWLHVRPFGDTLLTKCHVDA